MSLALLWGLVSSWRGGGGEYLFVLFTLLGGFSSSYGVAIEGGLFPLIISLEVSLWTIGCGFQGDILFPGGVDRLALVAL